jgi:beta-glucanase (GH16 family)
MQFYPNRPDLPRKSNSGGLGRYKANRMGSCTFAVLALLVAGTMYQAVTHQQVRINETIRSADRATKLGPPITWGKPSWADTFNGSKLNLKRWSVYDDPTGKYSGWRRTPESVKVHHGALELIGHYQRPYGYVGGGLSYNSNQTYGRWSVRFRVDRGAGWEPVILLWPQGRWPNDGEIDMAEIHNSSRRGGSEFLHLGRHNHFVGHPFPHYVNFTKWHILAVDWLRRHITFWLDGRPLWTVERGRGDKNYVPNTPFHLAIQNDEGCADHRCKPDKSTPKQVIMKVDWIRIWSAPAGAR